MILTIDGGVARTSDKASLVPLRMFEGRAHLAKDGRLSFPSSQHNISLFLQYFPNAEIKEAAHLDFAAHTPKKKRPPFSFKRTPLPHQKEAFEKHWEQEAFALFFCPGGGKSFSLTTLALKKWCESQIDALVVVTPNALVTDQWSRFGEEEPGQIERDVPEGIDCKSLGWAKTKKFECEFEELLAFDGFPVFVLNVDAVKTPRGKKFLNAFIDSFQGRVLFAVDESHLIKNKASGRFKACDEIGSRCDQRAILTGTPIGKDLVDLWSQFLFLQESIIGIRYKTAFLNNYCITRWNGFAQEVVGQKNVERLFAKIDPFTTRITQEELGLEKVFDVFEFKMHKEQKEHYESLRKRFLTQIDEDENMNVTNAISLMTRLQQVSNGYLVREDGAIVELPNARIEALQAWLETQDSDQKLMVWCRFRHDAYVIMKALGSSAIDISGNVAKNERTKNVKRFINEDRKRFCVGTPDAAGTGTDGIQSVCTRAIRYSLSLNLILHDQAENRTSRIGGDGTAFYTDLIGTGTLDRKFLRNLTNKREISKMSLDDVRSMMQHH